MMRSALILVFITSLILTIPDSSFAQSARDAIRALRQLEAKCEAGISYMDYDSALRDVNIEVDQFLKSEEAEKDLPSRVLVRRVVRHYKSAGLVWKIKTDSRMANPDVLHKDSEAVPMITGLYPGIEEPAEKGGAMVTSESGSSFLSITLIVSHIWGQASKDLKMAEDLLK